MKALLPENEVSRLAALRHYDVLDTAPELGFDDLSVPASNSVMSSEVPSLEIVSQ